MRCLKCGWCCKHLPVAIIADPKLGYRKDNVELHEAKGEPCKYLRGSEPGNYECAIHSEPWFHKTPCASHNTIFGDKIDCAMGQHLLQEAKNRSVSPEEVQRDCDIHIIGQHLEGEVGEDLAEAVKAGEWPLSWLNLRQLVELSERVWKLEVQRESERISRGK